MQVVHDFEHGGLTNDFLVNSLDRLAVRYNDRSPLENHHLAAAFTIMQQPDYHFLAGLPRAEFERFRKVGGVGRRCLATRLFWRFWRTCTRQSPCRCGARHALTHALCALRTITTTCLRPSCVCLPTGGD